MQPKHAPPPDAAGAQPRQERGRRGSHDEEALLCVTGHFNGVACFVAKTLVLKHEISTPNNDNVRVISIPPEDGREEELIAVGDHSNPSRSVLLYSPHRIDSPIRKLSASHSEPVYRLAYVSPRLVVSGSFGGTELVVSDVNSGEKVMDLKDALEYTTRITTTSTISPQEGRDPERRRGNGFVFVGGDLGDDDNSIRHYDLGRSERTNEVVKKFEGHTSWAYGFGYSTERNLLFSSSMDETLRIWSVQDGTCLGKLKLASRSYSLLYDPKKRLVFCGVDEGSIEVWDPRQTRERVREFDHPTKERWLEIHDLTQIDDETYASIGEGDYSVATWTDQGKLLAKAMTKGKNYGMCIVGPQSGMDRAAQEERIGFLLSFSTVFWGVEVRAYRCCVTMTHGMMHTGD